MKRTKAYNRMMNVLGTLTILMIMVAFVTGTVYTYTRTIEALNITAIFAVFGSIGLGTGLYLG